MRPEFCELTTYGHETVKDPPWDVHPRPQLRRERFISLNGSWDFAATACEEKSFPACYTEKILVPYPVESKLSGIHRHFPEGTSLWYSRTLPRLAHSSKERVLLHIDAVDQEADIFLNRQPAAHIHTFEGYDGIDITSFLEEHNTLTLRVTDDLGRKEFPYGKQAAKRGGMWYTPFSGIWQPIWLEIVPTDYIRSVRIRTTLKEAVITIDGPKDGAIRFEGKELPFHQGVATLAPAQPILWTPEQPYLYDFTVCCGEDAVHSYFALRTLSVRETGKGSRLCLNGEPFFFHGLLDQGYWPDGLCTPPDPACYAEDIQAMKDLGFNTLRKHIKTEPAQFYYECDRLGMIVFQDMINNGTYSFFKDTLLPTIGITRRNDKTMQKDPTVRKMFLSSMELTVSRLGNHPSVCCWTIFNEGWGQFESGKAYERLKKLDSSRFIDTASGWFRPDKSDVESRHVYFRKFRMPRSGKPVLLSEFGGYSCKIAGHSFNLSRTYGYRFFKECTSLTEALQRLYRDEIVPAAREGLSGAIYTQVSDVEDETNGLLTYDRAVCKADKSMLQAIARTLTLSKSR